MARVALDLMGGDGAPEVVADAVVALDLDALDIDLVLVGPPALASQLLFARGINVGTNPRLTILSATSGVLMNGDPLSHVRTNPNASVLVAAGAVGAGAVDAWVSVGHSGASVAAAVLSCGRVPGMSRPALAVVLPATSGPVVLVDVGAAPEATANVLTQFAMAGWCYATALGIPDPAVGLLNIGSEAGKGDALRLAADTLMQERLPALGVRYTGSVEGHDVATGARAQVIVTDGFTGNVLLKGMEGAVGWAAQQMALAYGNAIPARAVVAGTATGDFAAGMLLGVNGITVIGHGAGRPNEIAACVRMAARAAKSDLIGLTQRTFSTLLERAR
ncbi:MAG: phosphate acyltransferase PlsX [Actinomycetota bacterium]|nr:phosphate acyltransferase PlsX [Actinomycetota bacterium]